MEIKIKTCNKCPFCNMEFGACTHSGIEADDAFWGSAIADYGKPPPEKCPLRKEDAVIKLEE